MLAGNFTGVLRACINKKDMAYSLAFYELLPDGRCFKFSYYLIRADYANDPARRKLLVAGAVTDIPFTHTKITARPPGKGSRILVVLNIIKNPLSQVNHGTGKDVSDESIAGCRHPAAGKWYSGSYIRVPLNTRRSYSR
ncbi:MAG: hypothetical protein ACXVJD_03430 [Mucilaginibacter sp.]